MKTLLPFQRAATIALTLYGLFLLFHTLVLADIIPMEVTWGGRFDSRAELIPFELASIGILLVAGSLTAIRSGRLSLPALRGVARIGMWVLAILFLLNTLGNVLAETRLEQSFALITALLAICSTRLAMAP